MEETYYKKYGRRYIPVSQTIETNGWPEGFYLVHVRPGVTSIRTAIEMDAPSVLAAAKVAEDAMVNAMLEASHARPSSPPLTPTQIKAWGNMKKAFGRDIMLQYDSIYGVVEAGIKALKKAVRERKKGKR